MGSKTVATQPSDRSSVLPYHRFIDYKTSEGRETVYKVLVDSDEGRAYEKLTMDTNRLQYMKMHAHYKMVGVSPQFLFFDDLKARKSYLIRVGSPEHAVVAGMTEDSDEELEDGSEAQDVMFRYFVKHAHEVKDIKKGVESENLEARNRFESHL
jgi:hypothetical protein